MKTRSIWIDLMDPHLEYFADRTNLIFSYRWDVLELISKAVSQCDSFLESIKNTHSLSHFNTYTAAIARKLSEDQVPLTKGLTLPITTSALRC